MDTRFDMPQGTLDLARLGRKKLTEGADDWARLTTAVGFVLDMN